ncbi:MAG: membrane protein insertion efficiency factor YidD [Wenzhouxiangella sp.]|nr:MAG: membrane protein insertion efficiency factor YidD [Wenzhouxiangella sp.]
MQTLLLALIRAYRYLLSPWIGGHCRFTPTCSVYAMQAIEMYGAGRGSWLAVRRLLRCHPLCHGGHDPVPGTETESESESASVDCGGITTVRSDSHPRKPG